MLAQRLETVAALHSPRHVHKAEDIVQLVVAQPVEGRARGPGRGRGWHRECVR